MKSKGFPKEEINTSASRWVHIRSVEVCCSQSGLQRGSVLSISGNDILCDAFL